MNRYENEVENVILFLKFYGSEHCRFVERENVWYCESLKWRSTASMAAKCLVRSDQ